MEASYLRVRVSFVEQKENFTPTIRKQVDNNLIRGDQEGKRAVIIIIED